MDFKLVSDYKPTGDQPEAIEQLVSSLRGHSRHNTLLGVTGSGKTFTMANVIAQLNKPTLILSHNKTLAAQLYGEFKNFFPENAVEYFVSYYDYYQPEAYLPTTDTYIEKDLSINEGIEKMRLSTTSSLLSGRNDIVVVSSVSCIYGIGNPEDFHATSITLKVGDIISRNKLLYGLVDALYTRSETEFKQGTFRVKGDTVDIYIAYGDKCYRVVFYDNEIEAIYAVDPMTGQRLESLERIVVYPANLFVTTRERIERAIREIQLDLGKQCEFFESVGRPVEARRLKQRVEYDLEMIKELGYCPGIENYSRYFDGRAPGSRPFCLIDYFPKDFLLIVDESHVTIPQIRGMYGGDASRKHNLVEYGYRLPAAVDNRPLRFEEFESLENEVIYVSATPADYELIKSEGAVVEQFIRPTGLVDPSVEIRPTFNQIDDLVEEIDKRARVDERILVTTLTKRMAEELYKYFDHMGIRCRYIHSDVDTLERVQILDDLRAGLFDVLIGVNLLREGLDLPEVSLVAIMDADKEGFLRSARSLTQTSGRAARNVGGRVIMYADTITDSMRLSIQDTNRRREKQLYYNATHAVMPKQAIKSGTKIMSGESLGANYTLGVQGLDAAADPVAAYMTDRDIDVAIRLAREAMESAARDLDFTAAARYRDQMYALQERQKEMQGTASDKRPGPKK
ncbi:excinuclease ABC subunit UvrB [Alistipes indistinctus]|uniref:excinuclease ABC subunit UvrB n=1 Tax=Alistipes indistinctus TaxID=626932 RepID=UPI00122F8696|nr:excinuclease ABC subunit UvrB [Alistipes indistinctus]KAA3142680.1 excinuclease ABC subunit UvrB [Alistipes indistinctus]MBS1438749.1 excinuclease ABC subunit UvrB [Alistipes sp.]